MRTKREQVIFQAFHDQIEQSEFSSGLTLFFGLHGNGTVRYQSAEYAMPAGALLAVEPFELYQVDCSENAEMIAMQIPENLLHLAGWDLQNTCFCYAAGMSEKQEYQTIRVLFATIFQDFFQDQEQNASVIVSNVLKLLDLLSARFLVSDVQKAGSKREDTMRRMKRIMDHIHANWNEDISLWELAMHGYTCTGEIYAGNSGWYDVADKHGFIVVFPSALHAKVNMPEQGLMPDWAPLNAWNVFLEDDRPDELKFFSFLLDKMIAEYPVDAHRVFATGHSWGSLMTEMLALGLTERFAAVAPCSGAFFGGAYEKMTFLPYAAENGVQLPIWMFWGTNEEWLIPSEPTHENETGLTVELWLRRNGKADMIPADWAQRTCTLNGRFKDHCFDREGTALVQFTQVDYMPHATMPEMSFRIWEEFFSKLSRA